jgi:LemA protein
VSAADLALYAALGALAVIVVLVIVAYNRLVRSRNRVGEAWSGIDVQLKRRASLIPNLVETVRGYAAHEARVFEEVARARSGLVEGAGAAAAAGASQALTQALGRLVALAERYPELRASERFGELHTELADTEEKIAFARHFYNRNVLALNTRIQSFPGLLVARSLGFEPAEFFGAEDEGRAGVPVSFGAQAPPGS